MTLTRLICAFGPASLGMCLLFAAPAVAELAPRYTTWEDYAAVVNQPAIPSLLGVVDRIERVGHGKFLVSGGKCSVEIKIARESAKGPGGQPLAGGSHVARVDIGPKRCKP
jgi:hypothetical protein